MHTNPAGVVQHNVYNISGGLKHSHLVLTSGREIPVSQGATFTAAGEVLSQTHGNGIRETYEYHPQSRRLLRMTASRPAGHPAGAAVLQDLHYSYDPAGNILGRRDAAVATRYWRNQRVSAENSYQYDTLGRLASATGRELAVSGSTLAVPLPDDGAWTLYSEQYSYDDGDNLTSIRHQAPASNNNWTRTVTVSERSNRGLSREGLTPADVEELFSAGGAQRELADGRTLHWGADGQLAGVTPVSREHADDDQETYHYSGPGSRIRKVRTQLTAGTRRQDRVTYLPGLEWRESFSDGASVAKVAVIDAGNVRVIDNPARGEPLVRLSLKDHLGSAGLETDEHGALISQEAYYPYGGTAGYSARSEAEAADKTRRYSGKERDATGLYYYGYRYYQAEFGRWLSADPVGTVDGLNLYRMVKNNPTTLYDGNGLQASKKDIQKSMNQAVRFIDKALLEIEAKSETLDQVMDVFFNDSSNDRKNTWRADLKKIKEAIESTSFDQNIGIDTHESNVAAHIDARVKNALAGQKARLESLIEMARPEDRRQLIKDSAENNKYSDAARYLYVNAVTIEKAEKDYGKDFSSTIMIHEFSHFAIDTEDFAYSEEKGSPLALYQLARGIELTAPHRDMRKKSGFPTHMIPKTPSGQIDNSELAYRNADSFAYATTALAYTSSKKEHRHRRLKELTGF